jgi:hypothetical protein
LTLVLEHQANYNTRWYSESRIDPSPRLIVLIPLSQSILVSIEDTISSTSLVKNVCKVSSSSTKEWVQLIAPDSVPSAPTALQNRHTERNSQPSWEARATDRIEEDSTHLAVSYRPHLFSSKYTFQPVLWTRLAVPGPQHAEPCPLSRSNPPERHKMKRHYCRMLQLSFPGLLGDFSHETRSGDVQSTASWLGAHFCIGEKAIIDK